MKKILLALSILANAATGMAKGTEKDLYVKVQLKSSEKNYGTANMYAAFEEESRHGSGLEITAPTGRTIWNVNVGSESSYEPTVCGVVEYKGTEKGKPSSVKVKWHEIGIDDGNCSIEVILDNQEVYKLGIEMVGT